MIKHWMKRILLKIEVLKRVINRQKYLCSPEYEIIFLLLWASVFILTQTQIQRFWTLNDLISNYNGMIKCQKNEHESFSKWVLRITNNICLLLIVFYRLKNHTAKLKFFIARHGQKQWAQLILKTFNCNVLFHFCTFV